MGLLNYVTATSLDEDYAHVSRRRSASGQPSRRRPGMVALVVLAVFGMLVATAGVRTARDADESSNARAALVDQVNGRKATLAAERDRIVDLRRDVAALRNDNLDATNQSRAVRAQLARLGVATGARATTGPGIRVVVDDAVGGTSSKEQVHGQDLQRLANALWSIGAEAISINGQRLTSLSSIRDASDAITVNFRSLRAPYTVLAVGDPQTMGARLLETSGGQMWVTLQSTFGLQFDVTTEDSMTLPAAKRLTLRYAKQPERLQ